MIKLPQITVPRGQNVGHTINSVLQDLKLKDKVEIVFTDIHRDTHNKTIIANVGYVFEH